MKTYAPSYRTAYVAFAVVCVLCLFAFTGCAGGISAYKAAEVHRTIAGPGFSTEIHAVGIKKETDEDGTVKRKADTLTHSLSVLGFTRTVTYKGAELETKPEAEKK